MKKNALLLFGFLLCGSLCFSQTLQWQWAKASSGNGEEEGYDVTTDNSGNVYFTGSFYGDSITFGGVTLLNGGTANGFIVKYSSTGNVLWAITTCITTGSNCTVWADRIAIDGNANIYVAGYYQDYVGTGDSVIFGDSLLPNTSHDFFLAKYDSSGHFIWVRSANANSGSEAAGIATDVAGNIYVTGDFTGDTANFGNIALYNYGANPAEYNAIFILKYNGAGQLLWAQSPGSNANNEPEYGTAIATDSAGYVYVTGNYYSDSISFGNTTLHNAGFINIFLAKYDSAGNVVWAKSAGKSIIMAFGIAADGANHVYITGDFQNSNTLFDTVLLNGYNAASNSIFITQYDTAGNAIWAKTGLAPGFGTGYGLATDGNRNVYCTGGFTGSTITFDTAVLTVHGAGYDPIYMVEYNEAGNLLCSGVLGSGGDDQSGVHVDRNGNSYMVSDFEDVNPFVVGADTFTFNGTETAYITKFSCPNCYAANQPFYQLSSTSICAGDSALLTLTGGITGASVAPANFVTWLDSIHAVLRPDTTMQFIVSGHLPCGALVQHIFTLPVFIPRAVRITTDNAVLCPGETAQMCLPTGFTYLWNTGATTACITTDTTGNYSVTATDNGQCSAVSSQHITAISTQPFNINVHGDTLSYDSATVFQWLLNGHDITGATSSSYVAGAGGNYTLQITDTAGCPVVSNPVVILGISSIDDYFISIYPNPSSGNWEVEVDNRLLGTFAEVFDAAGKMIYKSIISNLHSTIDLSGAANGTYELRINLDGRKMVRKLIKM